MGLKVIAFNNGNYYERIACVCVYNISGSRKFPLQKKACLQAKKHAAVFFADWDSHSILFGDFLASPWWVFFFFKINITFIESR